MKDTETVTLDEAIRMFAGYVRGENGFDELDFKEWLIDWHEQEIAKARIDEQERTGTFKYDDGDVEIRVYHPTGQYVAQDIRIAELKAEMV